MSNTSVFINEIHYTNFGTDKYEGVEIAGPAGVNLKGWSLHFYESGTVYTSISLVGILPNLKNGFGTLFFSKKGLVDSNGGVALVDKNQKVVLFLSYDKELTAKDGPAEGQTSQLLPVHEGTFASADKSLQLVGEGTYYEDFKWVIQARSSGKLNTGQTFVPKPAPTGGRPQPHHHDKPAEPTPSPEPSHVADTAPESSKTVVTSVDFLAKQNKTAHHTDLYNIDTLIIRRGQPFSIQLQGNHVSSAKVDIILTSHPEEEDNVISVVPGGDPSDLTAQFNGDKITINVPGTIPIGQYSIDIRVDGNIVNYHPEPLIVLFNPWSSSDTVFLDNESWRDEYVLNEQGLLWRGSTGANGPCTWNFAQFQYKVLLASLKLITQIPLVERADPVVVTRKLTVLENDQVLVGNWSGKFDGGSTPSSWTGSKEIITQFYQTGQAVKFGQCWVFSGVLTSLTRTLGIPSRSVTNFESAHDTNGNRIVDKYYTADGNLDNKKTNDSVWNFHVWNDAWFARPDIADKRFAGPGWQAIDATPQEKSDGEYQTGPCPLSAIKEGVENLYDWKFIYGEVNADVRHYVKSKAGEFKLVRTETDSVGKEMSSKAVGKFERHDVTEDYKYPEGSKEERASFGAEDADKDLVVLGRIEFQETVIGKTIPVSFFLKSTKASGEEEKTVKVVLNVSVISYTGKQKGVIGNSTHNIKVPGDGSEVQLGYEITEADYLPFVHEDFHIDLQLLIYSDADADVDTIVTKRFSLKDRPPVIEAPEKIALDHEGIIVVHFTNPLSVPLTNLYFNVDGGGIVPLTKTAPRSLAPGETATEKFPIKDTKKAGERIFKVVVVSNELENAAGSKHIIVG